LRIRGSESGEQLVSNPVSGYRDIQIRGVDDRFQAGVPDDLMELFTSVVEQRAEEPFPTRGDSG
jgi:hypothetical protein